MEFFNSAIEVLQTLVVALGAGLGVWGAINLLEGYGNDNPGSKSQGITLEASVTKMMWVLGQTQDLRECRRLFYKTINHDLLFV